jgi:hypothetical protein
MCTGLRILSWLPTKLAEWIDENLQGTCDTAAADALRGSNVHEVKPWLWQFGRGKQRLGGLSVEETYDRKEAAHKERLLLGVGLAGVARLIGPDGNFGK